MIAEVPGSDSMGVQCAECGEELMGAVNRCWRCGAQFETPPEVAPPVRRGGAPTESDSAPPTAAPVEPVLAEAADASSSGEPAPTPESAGNAAPILAEQVAPPPESDSPQQAESVDSVAHTEPSEIPTPPRPIHVGSPFAPSGRREPLPTVYPKHAAAEGGAIVSVVLGVLSLGFAFILPIGGVLTSMLGVAMGAWGAYSRRQDVAILGMLLCCLALALGGFNFAVEIYTQLQGAPPQTQPPQF